LAFLCAFALVLGDAIAGGSITFSKKEVQEANGGWHLQMTIVYGGKPNTPHQPMRFTFTPTAIYENFLDDAHGDKPQKRTIPLVGQMPKNESVDVDFSDSRGKMYDRTRFDFTVSRAHDFSAGEYSVQVHRADGAQVGATQTLRFLGDNPVIDRRSISFVASPGKKDKDKDKAAPAADPAQPAGDKAAPAADPAAAAATPAADTSGAGDKPAAAEPGNDPAAQEKVQPSGKGCGCRAVGRAADGPSGHRTFGALAIGLVGLAFWRLQRRRTPVCPSPVPAEEKGHRI
jgi:MYXO-CTERM domain-containing protein